MIYTLSRQGGIDFSSILPSLRKQDIPILDSDALHERQMELDSDILKHFGEYSPRFRDLWGTHKDYYLSFLRLSVYRFAAQDLGVIYGHGASIILAQLPAIMKIKLIAPEDYRVALVAKAKQVSDHDARAMIHKRERERIGFHRFFFDADWNDEACYDLILNLSAGNFAGILDAALHVPFAEGQIAERKRRLQSLIRAEELSMELLFDKKLFIDLLKIEWNEEQRYIRLSGVIGDAKIQDKVADYIAERYPGFRIEADFELVHNSYLYFPSV